MARQIYFRSQAGPASVNLPQMPNVSHVPQIHSEGAEIVKGLADLGATLGKAYVRWDDKRQASLIEDAYLDARTQMAKWSAEYQRNNQGRDALEAQQAYEQQWATIAQDINQRYGDKLSGGAQHYLGRKLELGRLYAIDDGARWQKQQTAVWDNNRLQTQAALIADDVAQDPYNTARHEMNINQLEESWRRANPGQDSFAFRRKLVGDVAESVVSNVLARGDIAGAEAALQRFGGGAQTGGSVQVRPGIGNTTAQYESGSDGINAIGYDKNGGTSYGKWQLSSRQGSFNEWLDHLATKGEAGANAARAIRAAGEANTGSRKGAAVDAYKKEAAANPELFETSQREYIQAKHYGPMLQKLSPEQRNQIEANPALQEMAWSTAVQHGGAGGARILNRIWKPGMSDADMVNATYSARGGNFGSSTTEVQDAVKARFLGERGVILGMLNGRQQPRAADASPSYNGGVISPAKAMALDNMIKTKGKRIATDNFLTSTMGMTATDRLAKLNEMYGGNPDMREVYDACRQGIMHDAAAQESAKNLEKKERLQGLYRQMEGFADMPPAESWKKMQELALALPLEDRPDFYRVAHNLRNPSLKDDPYAVQEITERLANGEDVSVKAEYGSRITAKTAQRFVNNAYRNALPAIKTAFDDVANSWLAEKSNKNHAKELGVANKAALWTRFLSQTDADEKKDYARLRKEAEDFFKQVTLEKGFFNSDVDTIQGLEGSVLDRYDDARPAQGSPERIEAVEMLKAIGEEPEGRGSRYTDKQLSSAYRQLREMRKGAGNESAH
ncbi:MAG: hypothetical protein IJU37_11130 [Desulfovibrio sp.]|nr:hypothetical protein [Desulfovibrio sp.]